VFEAPGRTGRDRSRMTWGTGILSRSGPEYA